MARNKKSVLSVKWVRYLLMALGLGLIITISELLYRSRQPNQPNFIADVYLSLAQKSVAKEDLEGSLNNLNKATKYYLKENNLLFGGILPKNPAQPLLDTLNEATKQEVFALLQAKIPKAGEEENKLIISNIYYNLGLILFLRNYSGISFDFFQTSTYLDPENGFLYIELVNAYLYDGYLDKAISVLEQCRQFRPPRAQCETFLKINIPARDFGSVGEFKEVIEKHQGFGQDNASTYAH